MTRHKLNRVQFTNELSEKAFGVYSNSDFTFYEKNGVYYGADNSSTDDIYELGGIEDVNEFLESFAGVED